MKKFSVLAALFVLLAISACVHESALPDPDPNPGDTLKGDTSHPCSPDTVYFQQDVLPILVSNCAMSGCHSDASASDGVRLTNFQAVLQTAGISAGNPGNSELYEVLLKSDPDKRMPPPPAAPLSSAQISLIQRWISQGAKDLHCSETACDTTTITYSSHISPFISTYCLGCHGAAGASGGVKLTTYAEVKAASANGQLYGVVSGANGFPQMPPSGTVDPCDQLLIKAWANQGSPQ